MGCSPDLGMLWPWLLVRGESPSLQAIASTPEREVVTLCKMFSFLNLFFAELYLASACWLCSGGVSE